MTDDLEAAAKMLEQRAGNEIYRKAWRRAAKLLRSMRAEKVNPNDVEVNRQVDPESVSILPPGSR